MSTSDSRLWARGGDRLGSILGTNLEAPTSAVEGGPTGVTSTVYFLQNKVGLHIQKCRDQQLMRTFQFTGTSKKKKKGVCLYPETPKPLFLFLTKLLLNIDTKNYSTCDSRYTTDVLLVETSSLRFLSLRCDSCLTQELFIWLNSPSVFVNSPQP